MKIFISIKKKWLQHRVYKYTLKYQDALSKSDCYAKMSKRYDNEVHNYNYIRAYAYLSDLKQILKKVEKYSIKSSHYKHLSDLYLEKKLDLEEELQSLSFSKA